MAAGIRLSPRPGRQPFLNRRILQVSDVYELREWCKDVEKRLAEELRWCDEASSKELDEQLDCRRKRIEFLRSEIERYYQRVMATLRLH
jgi:hypothetical protein